MNDEKVDSGYIEFFNVFREQTRDQLLGRATISICNIMRSTVMKPLL